MMDETFSRKDQKKKLQRPQSIRLFLLRAFRFLILLCVKSFLFSQNPTESKFDRTLRLINRLLPPSCCRIPMAVPHIPA
jgi:hypothetical protein